VMNDCIFHKRVSLTAHPLPTCHLTDERSDSGCLTRESRLVLPIMKKHCGSVVYSPSDLIVRLHLLKLLRDCGQPFVELRTHEILKDSRFLVVLAGGKSELAIAAIEDELEGATLAESVFGSSLAAA
jgi:hypothetical protein